MEFGVNKNINFFYRNLTAILFVVLVLFVISIDTVNRYFFLLSIEDLENSKIYGTLRILLFLFLLVAFIFDQKSSNSKILIALYLYSFFSIISIFISSSTVDELIKSICYTLSFVFIFRYGIWYSNLNNSIRPTILSILLVVVVILLQFFNIYIFRFSSIFLISNDAIFSLIVFIPFLFFLKNKKLIIAILLLICVCTFFSQKRSAIIFVNLSLIIAAFIYFIKISKVKFVIISAMVILLSFSFFDSIRKFDTVIFAIDRFENAGDSGRNEISDEALTQIYNGDITNYLFGYGYSATVKHNGLPSHNDFLEILYDFGIFSFLSYCVVILLLGRKCIVWFKYRMQFMNYYLSFIVAYVMYLGLSLFNCMIFSVYTVVLFLSLGMSYGYITSKIKL